MQSKILLINPPNTAIGDRLPHAKLPSANLICMCGDLTDAGFAVEMLDAEGGAMNLFTIAHETRKRAPQFVLILCPVPSHKDNGIAKMLMAILKVSMPHLSVTHYDLHF